MDKKKSTERKLKRIMIKAHKVWMDYMDSIPEEGNKDGKDRAYLSLCLFRTSAMFDSTHEKDELSPEYQVSMSKIIEEGKTPDENGWRDYMKEMRGIKDEEN